MSEVMTVMRVPPDVGTYGDVPTSPPPPDPPSLGDVTLPTAGRVGDFESRHVYGRVIGFASSHRELHRHPGHQYAPLTEAWRNRREHCTACRWFEVRIIRLYDRSTGEPAEYAVHTLGNSCIPDDELFVRYVMTSSPYEVVELLTKRRGERVEIPGHSARALAGAAEHDEGIRRVYLEVVAA